MLRRRLGCWVKASAGRDAEEYEARDDMSRGGAVGAYDEGERHDN